jgi:hypothetical protein
MNSMYFDYFVASCGVRVCVEMSGTPQCKMCQVAYRLSDKSSFFPAHFLFSDIVDKEGGTAFANYIRRNKLGKVVQSPIAINPNSNHKIRVWIFTPDKKAIRKWYKKHA